MRTPTALAALFVSVTVSFACAESGGGGAAPTATSAAPASAPSPPTTSAQPAEAMPAPDDLDVAGLKKALKCAADAKSGPCGVLVAFGSCVTWNIAVPSGDGRWIGRGHRVEGGKTTDEFTMFRARRVPSNETAPGQLPVKIGIADLAKEEGTAFSQADKLINALARQDVPAKSNPALEYLKKRDQWPEGYAMRTAGGQVYVVAQGGAFVCQGPKQQLFLVQRAATRGAPGEGLYAELWNATW
jgi:hypothetical protein